MTSVGWRSFKFNEDDKCEWYSHTSPSHIASWNWPNCGKRYWMKSPNTCNACVRVTGQPKLFKVPGFAASLSLTKFITSRVTPSGYVPTSSDNVYMTVYLPASTHPEGHYPYIQVNVIDAYYAPVGLYMRIESARVGDGTSTPAIGPLTPVSQTLDLQFNGEMGYYQWGWSLTFSGSLDIDVGDTIISNEGAEGTVTSASFTGTQTIVYVSQQYAPLGVTYTRTRPTLAPGQVGTYTSMAYTLWDAYDMSSVVIFAGSGITKQPRSFRIKVWAQSANAIHIESINAVVMGIR